MSQVIVVTSGKGGVGKTTTVANLGAALAKLGKKVVLIDTDIGLRNLDLLLGLEDSVVYDLVDVVNGRTTPLQAAIAHKHIDGLYFIPAPQSMDKEAITAWQMQELCGLLRKEFDFIIIDCPAGIDQGFRNAVAAADKVLIVTIPELSAIRDADKVIGLLEADEIEDCCLVINRLRPNLIKKGNMLNVDDVMGILSVNLIGIIPEDEKIIVSANKGEPIALNPKSLAGQGFRNIAKRLTNKYVPLMDFDSNKFIRNIKKLYSKKY